MKCNKKILAVIVITITALLITGLGCFSDNVSNYTDRTYYTHGKKPIMGFTVYERHTPDRFELFSFPITMENGNVNEVSIYIDSYVGDGELNYTWVKSYGSGVFFDVSERYNNVVDIQAYDVTFNPTEVGTNYILNKMTTPLEFNITFSYSCKYYSNGALTSFISNETFTTTINNPYNILAPSLRGFNVPIYFDWYSVKIEPVNGGGDVPYTLRVAYDCPSSFYTIDLPPYTMDTYEDFNLPVLFNGVAEILDTQLFGTISIKQLLFITVGLGLLMMFLKFFAGG